MTANAELLIELYRRMLRIRLVEDRLCALYPEQQMRCPVHLCTGQEAIAVGICAALRREDYVLSGHRSHGHYLAKGGDLKAMLAELYGKATGCARGKGGSMHLVDLSAGFLGAAPVVGSTIPIAVGVAFGSVLRGEERVTAVFFGDGATETGVFHEAVNFAVLKSLPVLFVCENNLYSVYSPLSVRQPEGRLIHLQARAHGLETALGNGNDVAEVYELAVRAVAHLRGGKGPYFLELATYRWREHCGPNYDNDIGYRSEQEFQEWKARDPVSGLRERLLREKLLRPEQADVMAAEVNAEMDEAVAFAKNSPFPEAGSMHDDVYAP